MPSNIANIGGGPYVSDQTVVYMGDLRYSGAFIIGMVPRVLKNIQRSYIGDLCICHRQGHIHRVD